MLKNKGGITLIALIITIIVLLILAGVTINMVLGDNGLFNKAKTSVAKYENAQEKENSALAGYENELGSYINGNRDYETEIAELRAEINSLKTVTIIPKSTLTFNTEYINTSNAYFSIEKQNNLVKIDFTFFLNKAVSNSKLLVVSGLPPAMTPTYFTGVNCYETARPIRFTIQNDKMYIYWAGNITLDSTNGQALEGTVTYYTNT